MMQNGRIIDINLFSGAVAGEIYAKSRHTNYPSQLLSFALHYLPFASRFPLPHFTLVVLFALFFRSPLLRLLRRYG